VNDLVLGLELKDKGIEDGAVWAWIVLEVIVARLGVTATSFETGWVITALGREWAFKISDVLLLELEENLEKKEEAFLFLLCF